MKRGESKTAEKKGWDKAEENGGIESLRQEKLTLLAALFLLH